VFIRPEILKDIDTHALEVRPYLIVLASMIKERWSLGRIYTLPEGVMWSIKTKSGMHQSLQIEINNEKIFIDGSGLIGRSANSPSTQSWDISGVYSIGDPDSIEKAIDALNKVIANTRIFDD
jgi:hypothetical protein